MYKLVYFESENFIGIYNGLGKKRIELDLRDYTDKTVFIILGGNAHGKSTMLSILHPFSGTTDKRDKFIREDKEGYKLLLYEKQDETNIKIRIKHVYIPNKSGSHATKSFIYKIIDDKEIDLNPNGNVSSFLTVIEQEFGITEDFLRISAQNSDMVGLVNMTGANRKDHIYKFVPKADDTTIYQKIVSKKYRDVKIFLSSLVDKLGKMDDEVAVHERLKEIEEQTNYLADKRDRNIGKINKYKAEIESLDPQSSLLSQYNSIKSELKELNNKQEKLLSKFDKVISEHIEYRSITLQNIESFIYTNLKLKSKKWEELIELKSLISSKKQLKSSIYDSISEKESLIKQLSGVKAKKDIVNLLEEYREKLGKYNKRIKNLNTSLEAKDLIRGIDIIENLRSFLVDLYNNADDKKYLKLAYTASFNKDFDLKYTTARNKLDNLKDKINKLTVNIERLNSYEHLKDSIHKRPKECIIETCEFLNEYHKWSIIEKQLIKLKNDMIELTKEYNVLLDEVETLTEVYRLKPKIERIFDFYESNYSIISILPFSDSYNTHDKLTKRILEYNTLPEVENNFYDMIEILQDKKEYDEMRNVKIPLLERELENFTKNENLINSITSDINKLNKKYDKEAEEVESSIERLEKLENEHSILTDNEEILLDLKERLIRSDECKKDIMSLSDRFDKIKESSEKIEELKAKIDERKEKLKIIESKLRPLTQERDRYKYQEIKIKEYKMEKEILEENLQILSLIRDALSTNKGMAVDILKMYIDELRKNANMLLSDVFDGTLYLEQFEINDKEFLIPFQHNGDMGTDISKASSSEKSFISTCLSMAIVEQVLSNYGVLSLDEVDAGFNYQNKLIYCNILMKQLKRIGINQVFMITHSPEFYESYSHNLCYILFPDHNLNLKNKDHIRIY